MQSKAEVSGRKGITKDYLKSCSQKFNSNQFKPIKNEQVCITSKSKSKGQVSFQKCLDSEIDLNNVVSSLLLPVTLLFFVDFNLR